jgi:hypothetical protein
MTVTDPLFAIAQESIAPSIAARTVQSDLNQHNLQSQKNAETIAGEG